MSMMEHLSELRRRIIWVAVVFVAMMIVGIVAVDDVLDYLRSVPPADRMVWHAFSPWSGIKVYMQFAFVISLVGTLPIALYHLWAFIKPGLQKQEQRAAARYIPFSLLLGLIGLVFAYFVVFRMALHFTTTVNRNMLLEETYGIAEYFSFMMNILLPVSVLFELPVVVMFLTRLRLLSPQRLRKARRYAYFALTVVGVVLSPPDLISDLLVALPMFALYEVSILLSKIVHRKQRENEQAWEAGDALFE
jgi:sec-independent protein translocase protein TatC